MPRCIVCKEYFDLGTVCTRCRSDNAHWIAWQKNEPVEQGGLRGLLFFTEQYFHLPLLVVFTSLAFGLMATAGIWQIIRLPVCLLIVTATTLLNLTIVYGAYDGRHRARENELLAQFRATIRNKGPWVWLSPHLQTALILIIVLGSILILGYAIMESDLLRAVLQWLLFEPTYRPLEPEQVSQLAEIKAKAEQALPIVLLLGYIGGSFALAFFSSMLLSRQYASRMNEALPNPIFMQGDLLMQVVQGEVEKQLYQTGRSQSNNQESLQPRHDLGRESMQNIRRWSWETLERTPAGGIKLIGRAECADSRVEESITGHRTKYPEFMEYTVAADPWGRIIRITQGERRSQY